jgi:glucose-6-phosphate 1-epimerase
MNPFARFHTLTPGEGGLPKVTLTAPDGARAEIYPYGAHLTSWVPVGGVERLFVSRSSEFRLGEAIRGGVPVVFPQFSGRGPLPKHGFARTSTWRFLGAAQRLVGTEAGADGGVSARFELGETAASHALWPHPFRALLEVGLGGQRLALRLQISNTGEAPFSFMAALHTYFRVNDIAAARVGGLAGREYQVAGQPPAVQAGEWLAFDGEVDRVYPQAPTPLLLRSGLGTLQIAAAGFPDVVTWNPGSQKGASLPDLEPAGYHRFVCVEAAAVTPIELEPGQEWEGSQTIE